MFYITAKDLLITKQIEIIDKKKFAKAILDKNVEILMLCDFFIKNSNIPAKAV